MKIDYPDTDRGNDIQLERMEIVIDPHDHRYVWIYMLDENGARIEGAGFKMHDFMAHILKFYDENF